MGSAPEGSLRNSSVPKLMRFATWRPGASRPLEGPEVEGRQLGLGDVPEIGFGNIQRLDRLFQCFRRLPLSTS